MSVVCPRAEARVLLAEGEQVWRPGAWAGTCLDGGVTGREESERGSEQAQARPGRGFQTPIKSLGFTLSTVGIHWNILGEAGA